MKFQNTSCKIYSRRRFKIFGFKNRGSGKKNIDEYKIKITIIIIIFIILTFVAYKSFNPIFETLCKDKAKEIATKVTNEKSTEVMTKYEYDELFKIEKDTNDNINLISANILTINQITSDIAVEIQKALDSNKDNSIGIPVGSTTGLKVLSGRGPKINFRMSATGNVKTDLKSEFQEKSINQTLHKVYLEIESTVSILTPFEAIEENITNQVLLVENVIVGKIPETYYNLNGMGTTEKLLDIVE